MKLSEPAFPFDGRYDSNPPHGIMRGERHSGMTLRDYFAIHGDQPGQLEIAAAAGVLVREHCGLPWNDPKALELPTWLEWFHKLPQSERYRLYAEVRYSIADAMLKARELAAPSQPVTAGDATESE